MKKNLFLCLCFLLTTILVHGQDPPLVIGTLDNQFPNICSNGQSIINVTWSGGRPNYSVNFNVMDPSNPTVTVLRTFTQTNLSVTNAGYAYRPENGDVIGTSGDATILVEVIDNNDSSVFFPPTIVSVTPGPSAEVDFVPDICEGESVSLTGTASNFSIVEWTSFGSGTFDDDRSLTPIYTPSAADIAEGRVDIDFTAFPDDGSCSPESVITTIFIDPAPRAGNYTGTPAEVCNTNTAFPLTTLLDGSQDPGGSWSDVNGSGATISGIGFANFTAVTTGTYDFTYTVMGSGACSDDVETVTVNVEAEPNAGNFIGTPAEICNTATAFDLTTLLDGSQDSGGSWTDTNGSGAVISDNLVDFNGVVSGTYSFLYVVESLGNCTSDSANVVLNVTEAPTVSIASTAAICETEIFDLATIDPVFSSFDGLQWSSSGDGSFNDDASEAPLYTPGINDLINGSVTLTVEAIGAGSCATVAASTLVTFNVSPAVAFPANKVFYLQDAEVDLSQISDEIEIADTDTYNWNIIAGEGTFAAGASASTQIYPVYTPNESSYPASIVLQLLATNTSSDCSITQNFEFIIYDNPDYDALISFFETNSSELWSDTTNWSSYGTNISDWAGITVNENNRVIGIDLPSNGLEDISSLTSMVNNLVSLNVSENSLNFEQLQPFIGVTNFTYGNQDFQYNLPRDFIEFLDADITLSITAGASSNTYQWFKDSVQIDGQTNSSLVLNTVQRADQGFYYVEVNNDLLGDLTLSSTVTELKVSTIERDIAALRALYDSTNGDNWSTINWDTTSDNPLEWSSDEQDIVVEDNRVVEVNLPDNNLIGVVPEVLDEILGLRTINFANNALEDLPNLTRLSNLTSLDVSNNALGYDDLEPNVGISGFVFDSQASFGDSFDQKIPQGTGFSIDYTVAGSANTYQWFRNNEPIANANASSISFDSITFELMGEYRVEVKNELVNAIDPDFSLTSNSSEIIATADIRGSVSDANDFPTESGKVYLFAVQEGQAFDSVRLDNGNTFVNLLAEGAFLLPNVPLGDYLLYVDNNETDYPLLLNSYLPGTIDWELAETIALRNTIEGVKVVMEGEPAELIGTSVFSGFMEEEFEEGERSRPRRRVRGAGVSVRTLEVSTRDISFKSILSNGELVAYLETDENGEFVIPNLSAGRYVVKCNVPGVPMDEASDIIFELTGEDQESLEVSALWDQGKISVTRLRYTANETEISKSVSIYPNPSRGRFKIESSEDISSIFVLNAEGKLLEEVVGLGGKGEIREVDISNYPSGIYFMKIVWFDGSMVMTKIINE
jgi:hypothetical protein